jgi:DNA-directed RNA polymerase sigma subunit (sigma70/sigma32)
LKDYRVELKVKNNLLASAMERKGIASAAELARQSGVHQGYIGRYLNLQESIYDFRGEYRPQFMQLCEFFNLMPSELYPEAQMSEPLKSNKRVIEADASELTRIESQACDPALLIEAETRREVADTLLGTLTPRSAKVVSMRHGLDGVEHTYQQIGDELGIGSSRAMQIYQASLRKLRHPERLKYAGIDRYGELLESE